MQPETAKYLDDVIKASELIEKFTLDKSFLDSESEDMLRAAVERKIPIVSEVLMQARKLEPDAVATIRQLSK